MIVINKKDFKIEFDTIVTVGNFDGIHKGHKKLIYELNRNIAKNYKKVVLTFNPHPLEVVKKINIKKILLQEEKRIELKNLKVDYLINIPFDDLMMKKKAEDFFYKTIINNLNCKILIVGESFRFGRKNEGNIKLLRLLSKKNNIKLIVLPNYKINNEIVSSTSIRKKISKNDLEQAELMLGKKFYLTGTVVKGRQIGRTLGFKTANIKINRNKVLPYNGVYLTKTIIGTKSYKSISNLGYTPTIPSKFKGIETHILDFDQNIYGKKIKIIFYEFLRGEKKFSDIEKLKENIRTNVDYARSKKM